MDVVVPSICLSSLTGALLFYAGGRLSPRGEPGSLAEPAPAPMPTAPDPELEAERAARVRAEAETAGTVLARQQAVSALAEERARSKALRDELESERDARTRADAEAARERRRLVDEGTRLRAEMARLGAEAARLTEQLAARPPPPAPTRKGTTPGTGATPPRFNDVEARAAAAEARVAALTDELSKARAAADAGRAGAPDLAELQRRGLEVSMKLRTLEQRSGEIDRREAENADLRRRVEALSASAAEAEELRRRLRDLEAQGYARHPLDSLHEIEEMPVSEGKPELETSLALGLRDLAVREGRCRAAVLSDTRGLLIAAYGEADHRIELAAAASLTTTTVERLRELIPLGEVTSVVLVDQNDLVLRTRWLRWDDECFVLSTLGPGAPAFDDSAAEALRTQLSELIGAG
jgi:hypothetical protein